MNALFFVLFVSAGVATSTPPQTVDKPKHYEFDDDRVDGDVGGPDGASVTLAPQRRRESLIQIRRHFLPEIVHSAE